MARRFEATQATTIRDLQRVMTKISATSLRIERYDELLLFHELEVIYWR